MSTGRNFVIGVAAGLFGGAVLSMIEMGGMRIGKIPTPLIVNIERRIEDHFNLSERTTHKQKVLLSQVLHLLNSAFFGGLFGALRSFVRLPGVILGPLYGLFVYASVLAGFMPALGLTRVPWKMDRATATRELVLHVLYGTVVASMFDQLVSGDEDEFDPSI